MNENVKKVVRRIYEFDLKNSTLTDGNEMITTNRGSEFVNTFVKRDIDNGIMVVPSGYSKGLVYKSSNGGEFYNNPKWVPDVVTFCFNVFGLKKGAFYRLTVIGRNTWQYNRITDVTDDRTLEVSNDNQEVLVSADLKNVYDNTEFNGIFRATSNEINLFFRLGKIYVNNIIIDEIELMSDEVEEKVEVDPNVVLEEGSMKIAAYGVFNTIPANDENRGKYIEMTKITGKGINLYYDKTTKEYILERDNVEDTLNSSLTGIEYIIDFNFNKAVNKDYFSGYRITEVSPEISPNTLKQGYIKFVFVDKDENVIEYFNNTGRLAFIVNKIS